MRCRVGVLEWGSARRGVVRRTDELTRLSPCVCVARPGDVVRLVGESGLVEAQVAYEVCRRLGDAMAVGASSSNDGVASRVEVTAPHGTSSGLDPATALTDLYACVCLCVRVCLCEFSGGHGGGGGGGWVWRSRFRQEGIV